VDVGYLDDDTAVGAVVVGRDATLSTIEGERVVRLEVVAPYRPGAFYERELPALGAVLAGIPVSLLFVDGYVDLDPDGRPGLGAHAAIAFGCPVIGVAKTAFRTATHAIPVLRGTSIRPLFVTASGIPVSDAAEMVASMAGGNRLPDALKKVDRLTRSI